MQFLDDEEIRLRWLRKALHQGDVAACSTLGDLLSRSNCPRALAEAASAYKKAAGQPKPDPSVQRRLAEMILKGRGIQADKEAAVELFCAAGENGNSVALSQLARFIFNGEFGLDSDPARAFELFCRAHKMHREGLMYSASVALMLLQGIGVEPDLDKGAEKLRIAISIFAANKSTFRIAFDADACFAQVMAAIGASDETALDLPLARTFLDGPVRFGVPGARLLLDRCGGPLPPHEPQWELSLSSALPEKVKGNVWSVRSPVQHRIGQPSTLGQVEQLPSKRWIATTEAGVPVGETFESDRAAIEALAAAQDCDAPYVDIATKLRRMRDRAALKREPHGRRPH
ncbi:tetratricopeptide repeat protein [Phaeovulum sp.]|uniref:tetratricopeptide repeat protein n=1 Tax=Phaeovulum sp. TaxID=2934796 RepID=UPI00272F4822|nr:tetratricopeptide repeat protein [Phaeovulum sp.]MDP1667577.1 tetratricopeptide repeat protein [Phaeovulum sp.]